MATRHERVVLELEDRFTTGMARAAASAAILNKELDSLSRDSIRTKRSLSDIDSGTQTFARNAGGAGREIDKLSGRVRILADAAAVLGPALIPVGAIGIPAITGLAAQLGVAAVAGGTAVLAFQGVGEALKTLNKAALEPTEANLRDAQAAIEELSPAARGFVSEIGSLIPAFRDLRNIAAEGFFPGATEGLDALEAALPRIESIVAAVSLELGDIAGDVGASLASDRWSPFLDFVAAEAPVALSKMAEAAGNTAHAVAELFISTNPLNNDFLDFLVEATADLDRWAEGLRDTQGFADFLAYVETTGPKVADAFGAIANATVQILQAAAPLGGPVLDGIKALADVVAAIANSDLGTPLFTAAAGLALFNRTMGLTKRIGETTWGGYVAGEARAALGIRTLIGDLRLLQRESRIVTLPGKNFIGPLTEAQTAVTRLRRSIPAIGKTAAGIAALGVASTGAADKIGLTNTASLALAGTFIAPGFGTALGAAAGATLDLSHANDSLEDSLNRANAAVESRDLDALTQSLKDVSFQMRDLENQTGFLDTVGDSFANAFGGDLRSKLGSGSGLFGGLTENIFGGKSGADKLKESEAAIRDSLARTRAEAAKEFRINGLIATSKGLDTATQGVKDFEQSLKDLQDTLAGRASLRAYEQAIDDFAQRAIDRAKVLDQIRKEQADFDRSQANTARDLKDAKGDKGRIADIRAQAEANRVAHEQRMADLRAEAEELRNTNDIGTEGGRQTQAALDTIASTALAFAQTLQGTARAKFLEGARREFIETAREAGLTGKAAETLANKVLGLKNVSGNLRIVIDADGAYRVIDTVAEKLRKLPLNVQLNIQTGQNKGGAGGIDGDPNTPWASGGYTGPGRRLQPAGIVHRGEVVLPQDVVKRDRSHIASRYGFLPGMSRLKGYDNGGLVVPFGSSAAPEMDYGRLASAMLAARPMYGDVHISGDPTVFRRQMEADRALASLDGIAR